MLGLRFVQVIKGSQFNLDCEWRAAVEMHLINLERSVDRLEKFRHTNGHIKGVIRFPAVEGSSARREWGVGSGVFGNDLRYSEGAVGCALSHVALWKYAAETKRSKLMQKTE